MAPRESRVEARSPRAQPARRPRFYCRVCRMGLAPSGEGQGRSRGEVGEGRVTAPTLRDSPRPGAGGCRPLKAARRPTRKAALPHSN
jgi:hypothetical protein